MAFLLSPKGRYLIIGLAALAALSGALWYIRDSESTKVKLEVLQEEQKTEERTRDGVKSTPTDPDVILDGLRDRQSN